ncbi:FUSC family protein [Pseudolysinimonas sp.]|uniref:FUSC family protein n=1 Tax=Pseudolysinimonas sp. TaxID=2680009 RepID=UPI003F80F2BE
MSDQLRALERRIRRRIELRRAGARIAESLPAILQIVAAVAVSFSIAHWVIGHPTPILAVTVTITSLGLTRDARPGRIAQSILGIVLGVAVAEGLALFFGHGLWQLVVVLLVVFVIGRGIWPNPAFAVAAAVPSALVTVLPPTPDPFGRSIDAVVAGVVALLATALIPRDPGRTARRDRRAVFSLFDEGLSAVVAALDDADPAAGELGLTRLRRTEAPLQDWAASVETALAVARISPFLRRHLPALRRESALREAADLASRHLRTIARRVEFLVRDGVPRPAIAGLLRDVAGALRVIETEQEDPQAVGGARSLLADLARRLDPDLVEPGAPVVDAAAILLVRPLVVDLLVGLGMRADDARALLPPLD